MKRQRRTIASEALGLKKINYIKKKKQTKVLLLINLLLRACVMEGCKNDLL